jgi:hypothetical protein
LVAKQVKISDYSCRYTWDTKGKRNVNSLAADDKEGVTVMVASNCAAELLPFHMNIQGKTHVALDKFVKDDPEAWGAPPAGVTGRARAKHMKELAQRNGCSLNTGAHAQSLSLELIWFWVVLCNERSCSFVLCNGKSNGCMLCDETRYG